MKKIKKIFSLFLCSIILFSFSVIAYAEEVPNQSVCESTYQTASQSNGNIRAAWFPNIMNGYALYSEDGRTVTIKVQNIGIDPIDHVDVTLYYKTSGQWRKTKTHDFGSVWPGTDKKSFYIGSHEAAYVIINVQDGSQSITNTVVIKE